jgi:hypothetical protein
MLFYFLQVIIIQLIFLLFYDWFLQRETFFQWNRFYLIASGIVSFVLPIVHLGWWSSHDQWHETLAPVIIGSHQLQNSITVQVETGYQRELLLLYITGLLIFISIFVYKFFRIYRLISAHPVIDKGGYKIVLLGNQKEAFSFIHYIFIDKDLYRQNDLSVLNHELVHVRQKHWVDLLIFECFKMIFWFNPLLWWYQKRLLVLHEFIADRQVLKQNNLHDYFNRILQETFQVRNVSFINQFYQPELLKKRIMMQKRKPSKHWTKIKFLGFAVILTGLVFVVDACKNENGDENILTWDEVKQIDPENIENIVVKKNPPKITIITKNGEEKVYYFKEDEAYKVDDIINGKNNKPESETEKIAFQHITKAPVFPGCENLTSDEVRKCFSEKVADFVSRNFRKSLADSLNLSSKQVRILTMFTIDKNGVVSSIRVRSKYKKMEEEAKRVLSLLPKMQPGQKDGKNVDVVYTLPIVFKVE